MEMEHLDTFDQRRIRGNASGSGYLGICGCGRGCASGEHSGGQDKDEKDQCRCKANIYKHGHHVKNFHSVSSPDPPRTEWRTPATLGERASARSRARQQVFPSRSQLTSASLSPSPVCAFSRTSLGITSCPRPSIVRTASILHEASVSAPGFGRGFPFNSFHFPAYSMHCRSRRPRSVME